MKRSQNICLISSLIHAFICVDATYWSPDALKTKYERILVRQHYIADMLWVGQSHCRKPYVFVVALAKTLIKWPGTMWGVSCKQFHIPLLLKHVLRHKKQTNYFIRFYLFWNRPLFCTCWTTIHENRDATLWLLRLTDIPKQILYDNCNVTAFSQDKCSTFSSNWLCNPTFFCNFGLTRNNNFQIL